jgi:hypothetical protein
MLLRRTSYSLNRVFRPTMKFSRLYYASAVQGLLPPRQSTQRHREREPLSSIILPSRAPRRQRRRELSPDSSSDSSAHSTRIVLPSHASCSSASQRLRQSVHFAQNARASPRSPSLAVLVDGRRGHNPLVDLPLRRQSLGTEFARIPWSTPLLLLSRTMPNDERQRCRHCLPNWQRQ